MATLTAAEVEARWYKWAEQELGGPPERLSTVASAALAAVMDGLDVDGVEAAARHAASDYDSHRVSLDDRAGDATESTRFVRPPVRWWRIARAVATCILILAFFFGAFAIVTHHEKARGLIKRPVELSPAARHLLSH